MMTNKELAAKLIDVAKNYKTLYVMGCFGAPMTASNKKRYTQNHSYNRQPERTAMINAASADTFGFDCVCLIKGLLWGWNGNKNAIYGGATYTSSGVPDIGADQMIKVCKNVTTDFSKIEVGEAVWLEGHIGVYVGDGLAVECTPRWANKVQITACNRNVPGYNRRNWTKHGKLPYVKYVADTTTPPVETTEIRGIDVSKWQGEIDWKKVKAAGIKFAMIRLGYGSANGDACGLDGYFEKNVKNAIAAGIDIGCYFYSYATSVAAAKKEAAYVINVLQKYKGVFTYPVAFDLEDKTQQGLGKQVLTDMVIAFGDAIEKAGFYCSLYSNPSWMKSYLDADRVKRFDLWLAHWADKTNYAGAYGMWQNSSSGKVNGINGNVDTDFAYKDYPTIIKGKKLNGFTGSEQQPTVPDQPDPEPETTLKVGDLVKITGSKYYGGQNIPSWVKAKNWYVRQINGDRVVIDKSEDGQNAICSPVHASGLLLVRRGTDASTAQVYTVVKGDTLWGIAKKFLGSGYRYTEIVKLNGLKSSVIYSGQKLKIPQK